MKKLLPVFAVLVSCAVLLPAEAQANPQHERMKRCSQEAKEKTLKGDERKQFMSGCLKGKHPETAAAGASAAKPSPPAVKPAAAKPAAAAKDTVAETAAAEPRSKMKTCNQAATEQALKGDARKAYMSECLKG